MLWPFRDSGWAQVAETEACSVLLMTHGGSHFSWQSHRKLSLLMWLKGKKRKSSGHLKAAASDGTAGV